MEFAQAFSPGHVTGLFSIHESDNPLASGSLGAGFCLSEGMTSSVEFHHGSEDLFILNSETSLELPVSRNVVKHFFRRVGQKRKSFFTIRHSTRLPVGCGFGTSGAGALSLSLALNALYGNPLSFLEAATLAHVVEVELKTGLGTVIGETFGGFEIREAPGAPGVGRLANFSYDKDLNAVFLVYGPLSTSTVLKSPSIKDRINLAGATLRQELQNDPSVEKFLRLSQEFTYQSGLLPNRLLGVVEALARSEITASMLMFGDGLFTLVPSARLEQTLSAFRLFRGAGNVFSCLIDPEGGHVTDVH
ncbi:MAG: GHMP kinase [Spirochaetales bacterium]|nr:GHMP kinase [Spirochaetales bacterium]